jgi:hypothetical protein
MSRDITTAFNDALTDRVVKPLLAVKLDFSDGILRMWNGYGDLTMTVDGSSQTFTGGGDLMGSISNRRKFYASNEWCYLNSFWN